MVTKKHFFFLDYLCRNEAVQKAFYEIIKNCKTTSDKTSISSLVHLDSIILNTAVTFATTLGSGINGESMLYKISISDVCQNKAVKFRTTKKATTSTKSTKRIDILLPAAATNARFLCYVIFKNSAGLCRSGFAVDATFFNSVNLEKKS